MAQGNTDGMAAGCPGSAATAAQEFQSLYFQIYV